MCRGLDSRNLPSSLASLGEVKRVESLERLVEVTASELGVVDKLVEYMAYSRVVRRIGIRR